MASKESDSSCYCEGYNNGFQERHPEAYDVQKMEHKHDRFSN